MTDGAAGGEERDFFDRWLAHRDGSEDRSSSATVPPAWAPAVTAPPPAVAEALAAAVAEPVVAPEPEPVAVPEPVLAPEPVAVAVPAPEPVAVPVPEPSDPIDPIDDTTYDEVPVAPAAASEPSVPLPRTPASDDAREKPATTPKRPRLRKGDDAPPPLRHTFRPRTRARRAVAVGTLLAATAAVIGVYVASRERDTASIGIAATLWVLTGIIWAVHSGTSVTRVSVRGGQLDVVRQGVRTTFDLTSSYTPVEVHGRPGRPGWKVVFRRRDLSTFVIDPSMVDPAEFMRVLRYYRPGVDPEGD